MSLLPPAALLLAVHEEAIRKVKLRLATSALIARTLQACWNAGIGEDYVAVASRRGRVRAERDHLRDLEDLSRMQSAGMMR